MVSASGFEHTKPAQQWYAHNVPVTAVGYGRGPAKARPERIANDVLPPSATWRRDTAFLCSAKTPAPSGGRIKCGASAIKTPLLPSEMVFKTSAIVVSMGVYEMMCDLQKALTT